MPPATLRVVRVVKTLGVRKLTAWNHFTGYAGSMKGIKWMRRDVRGRVVLVTGASRGIGRRVAERIARLGARTAITARSADELTKLAAELKGCDVAVYPC